MRVLEVEDQDVLVARLTRLVTPFVEVVGGYKTHRDEVMLDWMELYASDGFVLTVVLLGEGSWDQVY